MSLFLPLIEQLNKNSVSYVAVGGFAVIVHGHARLTADIDFIFELSEPNIAKAVAALIAFGYRPRVPVDPVLLGNSEVRGKWIAEKGMKVFSFNSDANPLVGVDIFVEYPIPYEQLLDRSVTKEINGIKVRVASIDDIIAMKQQAARPKDLEDVRVLQIIADHERHKK